MKPVVIENPILNSPFIEPARHWKFSDEGITNEIVNSRRVSSYFVPIAPPRIRSKERQAVDTIRGVAVKRGYIEAASRNP